MRENLLTEILGLSAAERIRLAQDIWESVSQLPDSSKLSDEQRKELDRRLSLLDSNDSRGTPWKEVLDSIRAEK